jgi:hypothetical protein
VLLLEQARRGVVAAFYQGNLLLYVGGLALGAPFVRGILLCFLMHPFRVHTYSLQDQQ